MGGSAPQLGAPVVVLAVAALSLERFQTRLTPTYASCLAPAIVCGLNAGRAEPYVARPARSSARTSSLLRLCTCSLKSSNI